MIISCTFSKPSEEAKQIFDQPYLRIKAKATNTAGKSLYFIEKFTQTQVFHEQKTEEELNNFIEVHAGKTFKNCVIRTEEKEITYLANKKGKITKLEKTIKNENPVSTKNITWNKQKNYLIPEGKPIPFLVLLGIMTSDGKIIKSKYDKFRQINRFLEFINDILPQVQKQIPNDNPIRIADFGCGKSYLTFAVHYFLTEIKHLNVEIIGLDLKKDVIDWCNKVSCELNLKGLNFDTGNISSYEYKNNPDIVITLHACDTATDFALDYAVKHDCKVILSVPCCQHEINSQLNKNCVPSEFTPLLKYGIIKERFASLLTDSLRAEMLEDSGYNVQLLEFINMEGTPKNILIRAVKKQKNAEETTEQLSDAQKLMTVLNISPTLKKLLQK